MKAISSAANRRGPEAQPGLREPADLGLHGACACSVGLTEAARRAGLADQRPQQRHEGLVFGADLRRDRRVVENHRRPGQGPDLGAHFVGHAGQELINVFALAMKFGIPARQLKDNVYAYPTLSSDIKHMFARA